MKFGFFHLMPYTAIEDTSEGWPVPNRRCDPPTAERLYRDYIDMLCYAEECGFDWIGCNEHHFSPYGMMANCNLVGGALAYRTRRAKLAMLGNLIPLNNPIRVAEEYAMLDVMSGGRLVAGFMRGVPHEYIAYNIPPSDSWDRQREATDLIVRAWTEPEPFGWEGKHYRYKAISVWPKPIQQPHPPVVISASTDDSARFAAAVRATMAIGFLPSLEAGVTCVQAYHDAARAFGWEPTPEQVVIGMFTCIADTDDEACAIFEGGNAYFTKVLQGAPEDARRIVMQQTRYYENADVVRNRSGARTTLRSETMAEKAAKGTVICGSPDTVVAQIERLHAALGMGLLNLNFKLGNTPDAAVRHGMELFRDRVLPRVRHLGESATWNVANIA